MNKGLLILMCAILALLFGGVWYLQQETTEPAAVDPLRRVDYGTLRAITRRALENSETRTWTLRSEADSVVLELENREKVPGDRGAWRRVVALLEESRPVSDLEASDVNLQGWGLKPPSLVLVLQDASTEHRIEVSRPDLDDSVLYRKAGDEALFRVHRRVFADFRRDASRFRDPRLSTVALGSLTAFQVARAGRSPLNCRRVGGRWFVQRDEMLERADLLKVDQIAAALASETGSDLDPGMENNDWKKYATVNLSGLNGESARYEVFRADGVEFLTGRRSDEKQLRKLSGRLKLWLEVPVDQLRDPAFVGLGEKEVSLIRIEGPGLPEPLLLRYRDGRSWYVGQGRVVPRVDRSRFEAFRDRILNLRVHERLSEPLPFEPEFTMTIEFAGERERPDLIVEVSAPDENGRSLARRSDEPGVSRLAAADVQALKTPSWELMQRHVTTGSTAPILRVEIENSKGESVTVARKDGSASWQTEKGNLIDEKVLEPVIARLSFLSVADYLGRVGAEREAELFDQPLWRIRWLLPEERDEDGKPIVADEKAWDVGALVDEVHRACRINLYEGLVFTVKGEDLIFLDAAFSAVQGK